MLFSALSVLLLPLLARAQYGGPPAGNSGSGTSSASSAAAAAPSAPPSNSTAINIDVGAGGKFVYNPANITASNGTVVTFFFPSGSIPHSVTQSSFAQPCTYLAAANGSSGGFDSGLQNSVQFSITITNDQEPIWFHCKTPTHCGLGMVGSINAPASGNTFSAFQAAAVAIGSSEATETNTGAVTGGVGAIATAAPAATFAASGSSGSSSSSAGRTAASGGLALFAVAVSMLLA